MSNRQVIRSVTQFGIAVFIGWWLFGDTYAKYCGTTSSSGTTLRFAHFGTFEDYELWRSMIADFEAKHPTIRVRQEFVTGSMGHYALKLRQQLMTGTPPDVLLMQLGPFPEFVGQFEDLADLLMRSYADGQRLDDALDPLALSAFQFDGVQRGLPLSGGNLAIYVNRTCFDRASVFRGESITLPGPDWDIEAFRQTAARLTCDFDGDGQIDQFGFWLPRWVYYLPFLWSFGADLLSPDGTQWSFEGPQAVAAIQYYAGMITDEPVAPRDDEVPQLFQDTAFLTGRVAMCVNGPWFEPFLRKTRLADSYEVLPIPQGPGGRATRITWDSVVMRQGLEGMEREWAEAFIRFLLSRSVQDRIAESGKAFPARKVCLGTFVNGDVRRQTFVDSIPFSRLQPVVPRFAELDRAINRMLLRACDNPALDSIEQELETFARDPAVQNNLIQRSVGASP